MPISCVNAIDRQYPDYVEYSSYRIPAKGVKIPLDDEFLQCCDCTDNCKVKEGAPAVYGACMEDSLRAQWRFWVRQVFQKNKDGVWVGEWIDG